MHLNEVLSWIESHPGQPMVRGGKLASQAVRDAKTAATAQRAAANQAAANSRSSLSNSSSSSGKYPPGYRPTGDPRIDDPIAANQAQFQKYEQASMSPQLKRQLVAKENALKYGGSFEERGYIYTVDKPRKDIRINLDERLGFSDDVKARRAEEKSSANIEWGDEGEFSISADRQTITTPSKKKIVEREERQKLKDFLGQNKGAIFNIYESGKVIKQTSGRMAYPDILKETLSGKQISYGKAQGQAADLKGVVFPTGVLYFKGKEYGPPTKPEGFGITEKQGPSMPAQTPSVFSKSASQAAAPVSNIYSTVKQIAIPQGLKVPLGGEAAFVLNPPKEYKYDPTDELIKTISEKYTPSARDVLNPLAPSLVKPATLEEREKAKSATKNFLSTTSSKFKSDPLGVALPVAANIGISLLPIGGLNWIAKGAKTAAQQKWIRVAIKDTKGIFAKSEQPLFVTQKIAPGTKPESLSLLTSQQRSILERTTTKKEKGPVNISGEVRDIPPEIKSLSKSIGGTAVRPVQVEVTFAGQTSKGEPIVRMEALGVDTQNKFVFYNPKSKEFIPYEVWTKGTKPKSIGVLGSLSDPSQKKSLQASQQEFFGLTQSGKETFVSAPKASPSSKQLKHLAKKGLDISGQTGAVKSSLFDLAEKGGGVAEKIGLSQTFSLATAKKSPRAFGEFLFAGGQQPAKAKTSIGFLESQSTKFGGTSLKGSKFKDFISGDIFKPFKKGTEGSLKFTERSIEKKLFEIPHKERFTTFEKTPIPKSSFAFELQKINPLSFAKSSINYGVLKDATKRGVPAARGAKEGPDIWKGQYPSGKPQELVTPKIKPETKTSRDISIKALESKEILFTNPRFPGVYGGLGALGSVGVKQLGTSEYSEPNRQQDLPYRMIDPPQSNLFIGPQTKIKDNILSIKDVTPSLKIDNKLDFGVTPRFTNKTSPLITPKVGSKITTNIITIPGQKITQTPKQGFRLTSKTSQIFDQTPIQKTVPTTPPPPPPEPIIPIEPGFFFGPQSGRGGSAGFELLGETKDFVGNVPQGDITGIFGKKKEITYRSTGFTIKSLTKGKKGKKGKKESNPFGSSKSNISLFAGSSKKDNSNGNPFGSSKSNLNLFGGSKGKSISLFGKSKGGIKF